MSLAPLHFPLLGLQPKGHSIPPSHHVKLTVGGFGPLLLTNSLSFPCHPLCSSPLTTAQKISPLASLSSHCVGSIRPPLSAPQSTSSSHLALLWIRSHPRCNSIITTSRCLHLVTSYPPYTAFETHLRRCINLTTSQHQQHHTVYRSCPASDFYSYSQTRLNNMASSSQGMGLKRTCADPCSSSQTISKHPRIAPSPSTSSNVSPSTSSLVPSSDQGSNTDASTKARSYSFSSQVSSHSDSSSASFTSSTRSTTSDPFPRYSLGIPHLDVLLPTRDGLDLLHAYHQGIGWIHSPVDRTTLLETLEEAERHGADSIHPHRLACLLAALALGDLFSPCFSSSSASHHSSQSSPKRGKIWFGVASACLAGSRIDNNFTLQPTPDACSALYLMSTYLLCANDEELYHRSQGLTRLALVLAKSALFPSCGASVTPPTAQGQQTASQLPPSVHSPPASPSQLAASAATVSATSTDLDRLHCNRLFSDIIFHLRCQVLTFALPCTVDQPACPNMPPLLSNFSDVPTIQAIWTAFGTPLYPSLDPFGNRYSPNIFHNWKLGLADLMHQVSCLTNQTVTFENLASPASSSPQSATAEQEKSEGVNRKGRGRIMLPDHSHVVKLDERIRRYHASLPDFLLLHRPLPSDMAGKVDTDELDQIVCQRHMACSMVHRMLMALHRPWFLAALACRSRSAQTSIVNKQAGDVTAEQISTSPSSSSSQTEPGDQSIASPSIEQPSAPAMFSLSAVLRSATWQTETFASAAAIAPPQALVWWQFTNNALAAAIVQATALLRLSCPLRSSSAASSEPSTPANRPGSSSQFHSQVRTDLDKNICSFQNVAKRCKLAAKALPFLQRVGNAIDLGLCKPSGQDPSQAKPEPTQTLQQKPQLESTSTSNDSMASTQLNQASSEAFTCNNTLRTSTGINLSNSNEHSTIRTIDQSNRNNSNSISTSKSSQGLYKVQSEPTHSTQPLSVEAFSNSSNTAPRRASSAKSELENIFGPLASGLELPPGSETQISSATSSSIKPLYKQNLDPLPVPPHVTHDRDEHSSQPSFSDDVGSSSSSGIFPGTPGSRSPLMSARNTPPPEAKQAQQQKSTVDGTTGHNMSNQASDLVLQCIRFWQPDMLSTPSPAAHQHSRS